MGRNGLARAGEWRDTAVIQRRTQQRRLLALTNTTARIALHDCSHCPARPFEPASSIVRSCSLVKPQTPIHSDKTVNTSGQNRWTTKVIHPSRLLVSLFTTARIALYDRSHRFARLLVLLFTTARVRLHDTQSSFLSLMFQSDSRGVASSVTDYFPRPMLKSRRVTNSSSSVLTAMRKTAVPSFSLLSARMVAV